MTSSYWALIGVLALAAFSIRLLGLFAGDRIRHSRHAWVLDDVPGLIIVSLVAASLAGQPSTTWIAALVALGVAVWTNHIIATMCMGVFAFAMLQAFGA